ncbi:MAG: hypothetical protein WCK82_13815 [Bacteroidota bacterium]|jgi:hypothetical protein
MDIKTQLTKIVSTQLGWPSDEKTLEKNKAIIWQNPRKKDQGGQRLTDQGYDVFTVQMDMKSYEVDFPKEFTLTNQVLIWLDRFIDGPWYITKKSIVVFKEKTAVQLVLFSGDVAKFGMAKAMSLKSHTEENT